MITGITDLSPWKGPIEQALRYDIYGVTFEDLQAGVTSKALVALELDGKAVTVQELVEGHNGSRVLNTIVTAGEGSEAWFGCLLDSLCEIAREQGAQFLTCSGRPGWGRLLKRIGHSVRSVSYSIEVPYGR